MCLCRMHNYLKTICSQQQPELSVTEPMYEQTVFPEVAFGSGFQDISNAYQNILM